MVTDNEVKGIIYKITNLVNDKIYIGKTKTHHGNGKKYGIKKRLKCHIGNALANGTRACECPALYNAMRKHGTENFVIEEILQCDIEDVDEHETEIINMYNSTNRKIGYNIALGGGGRSVAIVSEETREKMCTSRGKNSENMNIRKFYRKGALVGYIAKRINQGKEYKKWFTSTKNSPKKNKKMAQEWLKNLREGILTGSFYNKASKLPSNISTIKENGVIVGYRIVFTRNYKKIYKQFQSKTTPLPKLLQNAIKYRDELLKKLDLNKSKN